MPVTEIFRGRQFGRFRRMRSLAAVVCVAMGFAGGFATHPDGVGASAPDEDRLPALVEALGDADEEVRRRAALKLRSFGRTAVLALVETLLSDNPVARSGAAHVLGRIGPEAESAVPALIVVLYDGDAKRRTTAAWALGQIGPAATDAIPALITLFEDGSPDVRRAVRLALAAFGEESVAALAKALENERSEHPTKRGQHASPDRPRGGRGDSGAKGLSKNN